MIDTLVLRRCPTRIHIQQFIALYHPSCPGLRHSSASPRLGMGVPLGSPQGSGGPPSALLSPSSFPLAHYDSPPPVPGSVVLSQPRWRRAFSHPSCEEARPSLSQRLCKRCKRAENQVRPHTVAFKTPEHIRNSTHQPGLSLPCPENQRLPQQPSTVLRHQLPGYCPDRDTVRSTSLTNSSSALQTQVSNSPQSFNVVLDTGSSDLWVTSVGCINCPEKDPGFDSNASSTFQPVTQDPTGDPISVAVEYYGSDTLEGSLARDTVAMGGFQVRNQSWVLVNQWATEIGVMGLAFEAVASTGVTPFWQTLA